ncbi:MAG: penicillin-binding transpeptidase domain-containing protein [Fibrobacteraceae bacterium]|nr:penicillin-binding transpeptidase domain-containing protein [Fibrobacteraceae bacterium]
MQCSRCAFGNGDSKAIPSAKEDIEDSLPQREYEENLILQQEKIDLAHVYAQKDTGLAHLMDNMLRRYHPDNALFLAVDAKTNEILAWGERRDSAVQNSPDYLSQATFPAASLAKTVTIAAAFESNRYSVDSEIPLIGGAHTLYKNQIRVPQNYHGETIPLHMAYGKSYNPPMAIIGMNLGVKRLKNAAYKFGFNRDFPDGIPDRSSYEPPDTGYGLAEVASGFTKSTTLSPLQAAAIVRSIVEKKPLEIPFEKNGAYGYAPTERIDLPDSKFSNSTYLGVREAMLTTAIKGTSRRHIMSTRNISRRFLDDLDIGGKTGSLDGDNPKGRYDWFMGFAQGKIDPSKAIVIVVMQAHGEIRSQAASLVAAILINYWARENLSIKGNDK